MAFIKATHYPISRLQARSISRNSPRQGRVGRIFTAAITQPLRGKRVIVLLTQGIRCAATLGCLTKSLRDSQRLSPALRRANCMKRNQAHGPRPAGFLCSVSSCDVGVSPKGFCKAAQGNALVVAHKCYEQIACHLMPVNGHFRRRRFGPGVYARWVERGEMSGVSPVYGVPAWTACRPVSRRPVNEPDIQANNCHPSHYPA